ncbi:tetratricopeptide repeat protein [Chitinophaga sp. S165]|uniref:tetratricopeptide repeat protein n=1 Tax=Chitinophaga sp. S165 TaxID=2135462 RepID=UPI000D8BE105|nr:tetratricopeptide repeat protein [Chitinophaga sp. S165]PWV51784.1 putative zinc finger protein [Chitinophaga sp. S165]
MSNLENNEKILKIFSNIRCLNRDQLPRYLDGRLTDVEKHLVEQHLVDCNLCFDALQVLQQQQYREKYQPLATSMQQYIRNSIKRISQVHKVERYQRQEQKKESFLIYFWVVAAIAISAGVIYLVQQQGKLKSPVSKAIASNADLPAAKSENPPLQAAVVTPVPAEEAPVLKTAQPPATTPAAPAATPPKPVVKTDSVKAAVKPPAAAPVTKDSAKKLPPPPSKPAEAKETTRVAVVHKDTPAVVKKTEDKPAPVKKEKEKEDVPEKKTAEASGTDEFLYKAAQVYHQQGDLNEAISRYKHLAESPGKYGELSRYQLAVCYRSKGQTGKARRMFKEVVRMNGSMKDKAQAALDNL